MPQIKKKGGGGGERGKKKKKKRKAHLKREAMSRNWPFCEQADERRYLANPSCRWLVRQNRVENVSIWANLLSVGWAEAFRVNLTFNNNYPFGWPRPNLLSLRNLSFLFTLPNPLALVLEIAKEWWYDNEIYYTHMHTCTYAYALANIHMCTLKHI